MTQKIRLRRRDLETLSQTELASLIHKMTQVDQANQARSLERYLETAHDKQREFHQAPHRIRYLLGGNRCLRESSLIETVDGPRAMGEISEPTQYLSYDRVSEGFRYSPGTAPFVKGREPLYRVIHDGGEFFSTLEHQVLCCDWRYREIGSLDPQKDRLIGPGQVARRILAIERQPFAEWYWDLQVLDTNNYVSGGVVHHNSGKTTGGTVEMLWRLLGTNPFKKCRVPIKAVSIVQDFENHCKNILEPKFKQWAPSGSIVHAEKNQNGAWRKVKFSTGSILDILSHDQDIKVFEGGDWDVAWFDEPPPQNIFTAVWRGLTDRGGDAYITATPITGPWMYQRVMRAKDGSDPLSWAIFVDTDENARNIGEGDEALGKKRIEEFISQLPPEERAARKGGQFLQMHGLIFKEWARPHHLIRPFTWPSDWVIWESIDPHPHKPWAVAWVGITQNGKKILLKSGLYEGVLDEIAQQILHERATLDIDRGLKPRIIRTLIDNSASVPLWSRSHTDPTARRKSVRDELEAIIGPQGNGPRVTVAPKNVKSKIELFQRLLHISQVDGRPDSDFFVFDTPENERFVYEIENYVWDTKRGGVLNGMKDSPVKKDDDILDAVMQVILTLPKSNEPPTVLRMKTGQSYTAR